MAYKHAEVAKKLGVKKIVIGECGHAHKTLSVVADLVDTGEFNIWRYIKAKGVASSLLTGFGQLIEKGGISREGVTGT